ncbi:unnamed protein product [Nesidiocoris tenuis]|uniref:Uncharacterized protein n=1 Tax=Nesidiocoris tenuis TaxID=355587 RepID=A0A6H5GLW1_9HEMI|nr:unnamed protein product [Nesidiocoris tenuis]
MPFPRSARQRRDGSLPSLEPLWRHLIAAESARSAIGYIMRRVSPPASSVAFRFRQLFGSASGSHADLSYGRLLTEWHSIDVLYF